MAAGWLDAFGDPGLGDRSGALQVEARAEVVLDVIAAGQGT
jgi:hypothetical protein